jgi:hypothetical protein
MLTGVGADTGMMASPLITPVGRELTVMVAVAVAVHPPVAVAVTV